MTLHPQAKAPAEPDGHLADRVRGAIHRSFCDRIRRRSAISSQSPEAETTPPDPDETTKGKPAMTTAPTRRRRRLPASLLLCAAAPALSLGAGCVGSGNVGTDILLMLIGVGGAIGTIALASHRGVMTTGVVVMTFVFWPAALIHVLTRERNPEKPDIGTPSND